MSDAYDQAVELVLSVLGGVVLPDDDASQDQDVVVVLPVRRRGRKDEVPPGQGGLF